MKSLRIILEKIRQRDFRYQLIRTERANCLSQHKKVLDTYPSVYSPSCFAKVKGLFIFIFITYHLSVNQQLPISPHFFSNKK